jgi:ABC-type glutathione transport system ATPase component
MSDRPTTAVAEPVLSVRQLRKVFGAQVAVDDMTFDLVPGRSLAIVGESGSGKTTVARMVVGLERPTSGTIVACGRDRSRPGRGGAERKQRAREVQIVFQDPYSSLDPRQSGTQLLDEVLRVHHDHDAVARRRVVAELADLVGLDRRQMQALPRALSGGQRQRLAIARALATDPRVLILDESVAALDVSIQAQVLNVLADIRDERGISYVFISHDLAVVRQLAEDAVVMQRGVIVERGRTADVLDRPQHPYTQLLRASVPGPGWRPRRRLGGAAGRPDRRGTSPASSRTPRRRRPGARRGAGSA